MGNLARSERLAGRLDEANSQIENLLLGDANSRVVHALIQLTSGAPRDAQGVVHLTVTPDDLARRTGVDDGKITEVLQRLERSRLVLSVRPADAAQPGSPRLAVPDVAKLQDFLEFLEMRERFGEL